MEEDEHGFSGRQTFFSFFIIKIGVDNLNLIHLKLLVPHICYFPTRIGLAERVSPPQCLTVRRRELARMEGPVGNKKTYMLSKQ